MLLDNSDAVLAELRRLKALGIGIVTDAFGTGNSSLSRLLTISCRKKERCQCVRW